MQRPCTGIEAATIPPFSKLNSLSAIQTLQKQAHLHVYLVISSLFKLQQLTQQFKTVRLMWIPSHIRLEAMAVDLVDVAAKNSLHQTHIQLIKPSISQIKNKANIIATHKALVQQQVWVQAGATTANWYKTATEYNNITISRSVSRKDAVIINRLRLGYPCNWEIGERVPKECIHCQAVVSHPLNSSDHTFRDVPDMETTQRRIVAVTCTRTLLELEESFQSIS